LDEILELSDRIAVMFNGRIMAVVPADRVTREQLGLLMAGVSVPELEGIGADASPEGRPQ
jgi:ABC-type sugar transport system ATPase subunit